MHCGIVVQTECCKDNCHTDKDVEEDVEEYDEGSADEEELEKSSVKTTVKFPDEWRP